MARGFLAGMTDYSHQSFSDIKEDLLYWNEICSDRIIWIDKTIFGLKEINYWETIAFDFRSEIYYSRKLFSTVAEEISLILEDIETEVTENHIHRLNSLSATAERENRDIGKAWHIDYDLGWKEYGSENFRVVEMLYGDTRDLVAGLTDLSNIAKRLKDFIGKMKQAETKSILNSATFGDNAILNIGDNNSITITKTKIKQGDFGALENLLLKHGVENKDIKELGEIIKSDNPDMEKKKFGDGVSKWIGNMVSKAAQNIWNIGIGAAGSLLAEALNSYYGWI